MAYQDYFSTAGLREQVAGATAPPPAIGANGQAIAPQRPMSVFGEKPWFADNQYSAGLATLKEPTARTGSNRYSGFDRGSSFDSSGIGDIAAGFGLSEADIPTGSGFLRDISDLKANYQSYNDRLSGSSPGLTKPGARTQDNSRREYGGLGGWTVAPQTEEQGRWWEPNSGGPGGGSYTGVGTVGRGIGQFNAQQDQEIQAAAQKYGVPANFLKAIIAHESSGDWDSNNYLNMNRPGSGPLMPYIGVYQNAANSRGFGSQFAQAKGNRMLQTEILAGVLRSQYDQLKSQNPSYDWLNVASYHYSGSPVPNGWTDEFQNLSNNKYVDNIRNWWNILEPGMGSNNGISGGGSLGGGTSGTGIGTQGIFGGKQWRVSQGHGPSEWSLGAGAYMYEYAKGVGVNGHPGIDYAMPAGTQVYIPKNGTVIRAGGSGSYYDVNGDRPGAGELRIQTSDGHLIIFGHMRNIPWKVGQQVTAGQLAGLTGSLNGDHLHLEVRVPGNTSTGWQAVDPEQYFSGQSIAYGGTGGTTGGMSTGAPSNKPWWEMYF